ncbi:MAG: hypothetical protein JSS70_03490 [Bacteroidetes bacterium]|nr:hypothetical protein [Bacteroidota bacterium]
MMKLNNRFIFLNILLLVLSGIDLSCNNGNGTVTEKRLEGYPEDVLKSVLLSADSLRTFPFTEQRAEEIKKSLQQPTPVLLCKDSLSNNQQLAQIIALNEPEFIHYVRNEANLPFRNEIFGVYPARESDFAGGNKPVDLKNVFRVEMYNYGLNLSSIALIDIKQGKALAVNHIPQAQPDIPVNLKDLAVQIAINSPEVQQALGYKPKDSTALMPNTKTSLNRTRCERSHHLCVAPTFVKEDKALWAIVDLTDFRLVGIRWTNTGTTGPAAPITEKKLQDDKISSCFCELEQSLSKDGWNMKYMLTSSDGLRISDVTFNNQPVLRSAKLVDWHVNYSGTDGFGYSDAVGCPYFSQAAVVAWSVPEVAELQNDRNETIGFALEQTFRSEGWPTPCNYNYRQRYEFYNDGRFRVAAASIGRGCGNDGTYRPVFRIALAGNTNNFYSWNNNNWDNWTQEKWNEQTAQTAYSPEGYLYKTTGRENGYFIEPGNGQFGDGGKGDFSFVYVTKNVTGKDEGESDLVTIGPCCNTDYHQGPEKFIEPQPENIQNSSLVIWYVAQLKNNDQKGNEYCWAESVLQNGVYVTKTYPCFCGPLFIPVKK